MARTVNIIKAFEKLPYEAQMQIQEIYCPDHDKEVNDLTIQEVIREVEWTVNRMKMDMSDYDCNELEYQTASKTIKACKIWLKQYNK